MAKFPSQNLMTYDVTAISDSTMTDLGHLNIPKDLSIVNRRGYASTSRSGVPLVYRTRFTFQLGDDLGRRLYSTGDESTPYPADMMATLKITGCQNNWVMRNAAVKFHAAYHNTLKKAGVLKKHLGAYANEIRYAFDAHDDTFLTPIDGEGNAFAGGTWDLTDLFTESDTSGFKLKLVGQHLDEEGGNTATAVHIGQSYLASRSHVPADSNLESSESPQKFSILNEMLRDGQTSGVDDNVIVEMRDQGDNPPYEVDPDNANSDITESIELGRAVVSLARPTASVTVDVPFGICTLKGAVDLDGTSTDEPNGLVQAKVLKIFEMQG